MEIACQNRYYWKKCIFHDYDKLVDLSVSDRCQWIAILAIDFSIDEMLHMKDDSWKFSTICVLADTIFQNSIRFISTQIKRLHSIWFQWYVQFRAIIVRNIEQIELFGMLEYIEIEVQKGGVIQK